MTDIRGLFKSPALDVEALFKPIYLGVEQKRRRLKEQQQSEDRSFSRRMAEQQDARAEKSASRQDDANLRANKASDMAMKKYEADMLERTGSLEDIKAFSPAMYERVVQERDSKKLTNDLKRVSARRMNAFIDKLKFATNKTEQLNGEIEKKKKLDNDWVNIVTSMSNLTGNLAKNGYISDEAKTILDIPLDKINGKFAIQYKNKLLSLLDTGKDVPTKYVDAIYALDDAVHIHNAEYERVNSLGIKNIDIKREFDDGNIATKKNSAFAGIETAIEKAFSDPKSTSKSPAIMSSLRTYRKHFGNSLGTPKQMLSALQQYMLTGDIPKSVSGDDKKSYLARALFKKMARKIGSEIRHSKYSDEQQPFTGTKYWE